MTKQEVERRVEHQKYQIRLGLLMNLSYREIGSVIGISAAQVNNYVIKYELTNPKDERLKYYKALIKV